MRIEPKNWLPSSFGRAAKFIDVLRHPSDDYFFLSDEEKDKLRQSQLNVDEVIRLLGFHGDHVLVMKSDQVLGWVLNDAIIQDNSTHQFEPSTTLRQTANQFFAHWHGTPYVWGGVTKAGIDCSGFSQRYYLDVLNRVIPKNSHNQRKVGSSKDISQIIDHDLVFCTRIGGSGIHHVGIFHEGEVWHAHGERGVIGQSLNDFLADYLVLDVVNLGDG